jgi:hypothetical protein
MVSPPWLEHGTHSLEGGYLTTGGLGRTRKRNGELGYAATAWVRPNAAHGTPYWTQLPTSFTDRFPLGS